MVDFFHLFIISRSTEIVSNFWLLGRFDQAVAFKIFFFFFSFKYVMDNQKKMTHRFQIVLEIPLAAMVAIVVEWAPLSILLKLTL